VLLELKPAASSWPSPRRNASFFSIFAAGRHGAFLILRLIILMTKLNSSPFTGTGIVAVAPPPSSSPYAQLIPPAMRIEKERDTDKKTGNSVEGGGGEASPLPLIVALNCLEDCLLEQEAVQEVAQIQHVSLSQITEGKIEAAIAVLLHSLTFLPRAAQRRLQSWQLILCLGSVDKASDSSLATELGLHLLHVDTGRAEEVADTVVALVLGLLRHTHVLSSSGMCSSGGWQLGSSIQPLCRGMRRCRGLVMGIIGRSPSACALASRTLAFKMKVFYFEIQDVSSFLFLSLCCFIFLEPLS
jgi:hypothetical protein